MVTADAMFTHRDVCRAVRDRGGECLLYAKDNQAGLRDDPEAAFAAGAGGFPPYRQGRRGENARSATRGKGDGRVEARTLTTTTWLNGYLGRPGVGQAFRLERRRVRGRPRSRSSTG